MTLYEAYLASHPPTVLISGANLPGLGAIAWKLAAAGFHVDTLGPADDADARVADVALVVYENDLRSLGTIVTLRASDACRTIIVIVPPGDDAAESAALRCGADHVISSSTELDALETLLLDACRARGDVP